MKRRSAVRGNFYGNNYWLIEQLQKNDNVQDVSEVGIAVRFSTARSAYVVYTPSSDEYRVTADVVDKAHEAGATMVAYSSFWCGDTEEGQARAKELGVTVMPYGAFFGMLRKRL